jgi:hypothetical protein
VIFWVEWRFAHARFFGLVASIIAFIIAFAFGVFVGAFAIVSAVFAAITFFPLFVAGVATVFGTSNIFIYSFANIVTIPLVGVVAFACVAAFAIAFPTISFVTGVVVIIGALAVALLFNTRYKIIEIYQQRADAAHQQLTSVKEVREESNRRRENWEMLCTLLSLRASATMGLAGRRGVGKTDFLTRMLNQNNPTYGQSALTVQDFKKWLSSTENIPVVGTSLEARQLNFENIERLHKVTCFVRSPADFDEMSFLSALFEQVALSVDAALARLIPAVKPSPVARELETKAIHQRFVHRLYILLYVMLLLAVGVFIYHLPKNIPDYFEPAISTQTAVDSSTIITTVSKIQSGDSLVQKKSVVQDSLRLVRALQNSELYHIFLDSLDQQTRSLRDSLRQIEKQWQTLLNPPKSRFLQLPLWYENGGRFSIERQINYLTILDSLLKSMPNAYQPLVDSLITMFRVGHVRLDSIVTQTKRYKQLSTTLNSYDNRLQKIKHSEKIPLQGLWLVFACLLLLPIVMWVFGALGYEPGSSLHDPLYQRRLSNEIILYLRTQEVLSRLRFHHAFAEGQEVSLGWGGKLGLSLGFGKSKQVTREQVPFTLLNLVEEYRTYVREVCHYLNLALEEDRKGRGKINVTTNEVKIYIAIDELDKVLDTDVTPNAQIH